MFKKSILALVLISFLISSCSGGCPFGKKEGLPVQPSAETKEKFDVIKDWIPNEIDVILIADIYKISQSKLWDIISKNGHNVLMNYFKTPGLDFKSDIGLVTIFLKVDSPTEVQGPVILIQGGFHQDLIVSRIRQEVSSEGVELKFEDYNKIKIYTEVRTADFEVNPYSFAALDTGVIAIAKKENIKWMIDSKAVKKTGALTDGIDWNGALWGRFKPSIKLSPLLPLPWNDVLNISLVASIKNGISATLEIDVKPDGAKDKIKTALEGLKAIEALQIEDNVKMLTVIEKITVEEKENKIIARIPEDLKLLEIITEEKVQEEENE